MYILLEAKRTCKRTRAKIASKKEKMAITIFNLGLPKSGTSTLQVALHSAGRETLHWYSRRADTYIGAAMYKRYLAGQSITHDFQWADAITQADLMTLETSYWPQMDPALMKALLAQNQGMRFTLNIRDPAKTADSMERWSNFMTRLHKIGAPGLPPRMASRKGAIVRWIEGHYANIRATYGDSLVEYDIEDPRAPEILSAALGFDLPWWGLSNKNNGQYIPDVR